MPPMMAINAAMLIATIILVFGFILVYWFVGFAACCDAIVLCWWLLCVFNSWQFPGAVEHRFRWPVITNREIEWPTCGRGQPVGFSRCPRRGRLDVEIERAVGVVLARHPRGKIIPVEGVGHIETLRVIHRY